jgi:pSer/pThr/pTyr-binding forkhead associated (FHA) protein
MKLSLVVLTPGKMEGKSIPVTLSQFLIGRDPQCQLRPASALISKRHCAVLVRGWQVFVRDFDSTNGTFLNDEPVRGERELKDGDRLKVGPLEFRVAFEATPAVSKPTPVPASSTASTEDDAAAAMLLSLQDDGPAPGSPGVDSEGIPTGSTVMERVQLPGEDEAAQAEQSSQGDGKGGAASREAAAKAAQGNTSSAAKAILEKYMRRPRN